MKYLITIVLLLLASAAVGQVTEEWVARYRSGNDGSDQANALVLDGEGNIYVTGGMGIYGSYSAYATIKYDSEGNQLWVAHYSGPGSFQEDEAYALAVDPDQNVYVTGYSYGSGTERDYATVKYDSEGNQLWAARYNGPGNDYDAAKALAVDAQGNVYVTGRSQGSGTGQEYATIKYDTNGDQLWLVRYDGPGSGNDYAQDLALDVSGNVHVTGRGAGSNGDYTTIKYDPNGNELWVARYDGPVAGRDWAQAVGVDASGNVYATGRSKGSDDDYATIKYDADGGQLWAARYDGSVLGADWAEALFVDGGGNVYVTGLSWGGWDTDDDYATIKYDSNGNQLWVVRYNGPVAGDWAYALAVDAEGNVYVTGASSDSDTTCDYATIKYSQQTAVDIRPGDNPVPTCFSLSCRPNPFNATTHIAYRLPEAGQVSLNIYNLGGQLIETLVDDYQDVGGYRITWDASNHSSGIYFYRLTTGDYTETRRTTLLK